MPKLKDYLRLVLAIVIVALTTGVFSAGSVFAAKKEPVGLIEDDSEEELEEEEEEEKHKTVYKGQDYSHVYDYDYYTTKVHPELAGKSDTKVLKYFVTKGIPNRERGNKDFSCRWLYNQSPRLRYKYRRDWRKYYMYYQRTGYRKGAVARCPKLKDPINYYIQDGKRIYLKRIYDFEYFTKHYSPAYKYWKTRDDVGAIKYFVRTCMKFGVQAKEGVNPSSARYRRYVKKFYPDYKSYEFYNAQQYDSSNGWLILLNQGKHTVSIFTGSQNNWKLEKQFTCSIGKPSTPTVLGTFYTGQKGLSFVSGGVVRCWYYTRFYGGYMFHSVLYSTASQPVWIADGTLGGNVSHGCVRLAIENAKWIYDNVPSGTKVISYNRPF